MDPNLIAREMARQGTQFPAASVIQHAPEPISNLSLSGGPVGRPTAPRPQFSHNIGMIQPPAAPAYQPPQPQPPAQSFEAQQARFLEQRGTLPDSASFGALPAPAPTLARSVERSVQPPVQPPHEIPQDAPPTGPQAPSVEIDPEPISDEKTAEKPEHMGGDPRFYSKDPTVVAEAQKQHGPGPEAVKK